MEFIFTTVLVQTTVKLITVRAIISFNFSFDVIVVSNIADIMINIEIIINVADRG